MKTPNLRQIALINQKGGVGKTTSTTNLGACLAHLGKRVLLIDLDPQANLSIHLGIDVYSLPATMYDILVNDLPMADVVQHDVRERLDVVPSHIDLSGVEVELAAAVGRERLLKESIDRYLASCDVAYDYVLVNCPPSLGILSMNAMTAAREIFVPIQSEFFALQGMSKLIDVVDLVRRRINGLLRVTGVVVCMVDMRKNLAREVVEEIREYFGERVFQAMIRSNVALAEAPSHGMSIVEYAPRSYGAEDYLALAEEVIAQTEPRENKDEDSRVSGQADLRPVPDSDTSRQSRPDGG